jgi:hypothetical protein
MYIFADESGDLGFNFNKIGTSRYFIISLLICSDEESANEIRRAIKRTLITKINRGKNRKFSNELKGACISYNVKRYLYNQLIMIKNWELYSLIVNKHTFKQPKYIKTKAHLYDFFMGCLFDKINYNKLKSKLVITVDRCKTPQEIYNFNNHITGIIYPKLKIKPTLTINHELSYNEKVLQAIDLFCNGIYKKYENQDTEWYNSFKKKYCS